MSALISALDNFTPSQLGEKGSIEYAWSNSIRERIIQLSFQLTRTRDQTVIQNLYIQTDKLLKDLKASYNSSSLSREEYVEFMSLLFRMVGHTRDIIDGKGEYTLAYMLLDVWYNHYPELAKFALRYFVMPLDVPSDNHQYGSWKDIKYFYSYIHTNNKTSPLLPYVKQLLLEQLKNDSTNENPSLAAKWVPREKSKHRHLFNQLALEYFSEYISSAKTADSKNRAAIKAKMDFRKLISSLNKKLDTVQIKQCSKNWAAIDPANQTSITMHKQKKAFLNVDSKGEQRFQDDDRIECANKFKEFAEKASKGEVEIKGKRVGLNDFTKEACNLTPDSVEAQILNAQWIDSSKQTGALGKMIAMVDVSGSMDGDPMNAAIALGIRIAEKSLLGKRVLTFSASPSWVNLEGYNTFVEMVHIVRAANWGMNTNFAAALTMILDAIISQKLKPEDVEDMVLVILSDMQMDQAEPNSKSVLDSIEKAYAVAGQRLWNKPFKPPHILFWNLRSTSGFPSLSSQKNCSMMSGFSPALLNLFCEEGLSSLQSCTPWSLFTKSLDNKRYQIMDQYIRENL